MYQIGYIMVCTQLGTINHIPMIFLRPVRILLPGAFLSDLRASKLWYNSLLILTMDVRNFEKLKGVPKKIQSMFFEAGVKNQNFKLDPIALKFCMGL